MRRISIAALLLISLQAVAQKGLGEVIAAEKSFAAYAVANNTRDAFVQFLDTAAVMFDGGKPVNGYRLWAAKPVRSGVLNWRPRYAEVAASGNFGFTCGPWTYQPKTVTDSVVATGYFFTIWQKKGDNWKVIYDGGTDGGSAMADTAVLKLTTPKSTGNAATLLAAEKGFITAQQSGRKGYSTFLSKASVLCNNTSGLVTRSADQAKLIAALPAIKYTVIGHGISDSGDLGYVYGNTLVAGKTDFYFRLWRKEKGGWKLAAEMVR